MLGRALVAKEDSDVGTAPLGVFLVAVKANLTQFEWWLNTYLVFRNEKELRNHLVTNFVVDELS